MDGEIWKDVPEYEGIYQASNLGRIKNLKKGKEKILKPSMHRTGYYFVNFYTENKRKVFFVHQLIAMAFLNHKPCGLKLVIDHINDNPIDNRVENLQVVTQRFNSCKTQGKYTSQYKGVSWEKEKKRWRAQILINGRNKRLGRFKVEFDAHLAYQKELNIINNK